MEHAIKQLKALQLTRTFMCHLLNLADCFKQTFMGLQANVYGLTLMG